MIRLESVGFDRSLLNRLGLLLAVKMVLKFSHRVVVTMKSYVKILGGRYGADNVVYIPHGCWFTTAKPKWRWSGGGNILFLGHLAPYKDLDSLAEAVGALSGRMRVKLLVSGGAHPNFSESLKLLDHVRGLPYVQYLGHVPDECLPELAETVDLAVLPYKTNTGTSGVLHLLSGLGIPTVASDTPEFRELLSEGAGILLSSLDVPTLSSTIERVLDDRMLAESLSKRAVEFARERSWDRVAEKYVRLYGSLH
jgi:glycosyltransferase involved in cell wall biosynthesis